MNNHRKNSALAAKNHRTIIIGAGPAGLTAAYELVIQGSRPIVLEKDTMVGGLARTVTYKGYRFDIGGHRFFTKVHEVNQLWHDMLGDDFIRVSRQSRIYYKDKFYDYPLNLLNTLSNLRLIESSAILLSYVKWKMFPYREEESLDKWVTNRFGRRLYRTFFQSYTEKVWGIPCSKIHADWAAQRIKGLSLKSVLSNVFFKGNHVKSLIDEFYYPRLGPGMMWQRFQEKVESQGGQVYLNTKVVRVRREGRQIKSINVQRGEKKIEIFGENFISSMPITALIKKLDPPPPYKVLRAAENLSYRAFILVGLIINQTELFSDNWIYIHSPDVKVGRIQNFKNWSADMVPDPAKTSLGMEYFCSEGDDIWRMSDANLIQLATAELTSLKLAEASDVVDGVVIRQPKAYPVYDANYRQFLQTVQDFLANIDNLQTIGRNGMHRYNNQDHSMLMGMLAVRNLFGEKHDLWQVNTERSYYEDFTTRQEKEVVA